MTFCRYWKYYGYVLEEGPRDISQLGLPPDLEKPDAAFVWGGNDKTYYFKGKNYWRYNEYNKKVDPNYPRSIEVWGEESYFILFGITLFKLGQSLMRCLFDHCA